MRNAVAGGVRAGALTALGSALGLLAWGVASAAGLAALLATSAALFTAVKLIGAHVDATVLAAAQAAAA